MNAYCCVNLKNNYEIWRNVKALLEEQDVLIIIDNDLDNPLILKEISLRPSTYCVSNKRDTNFLEKVYPYIHYVNDNKDILTLSSTIIEKYKIDNSILIDLNDFIYLGLF